MKAKHPKSIADKAWQLQIPQTPKREKIVLSENQTKVIRDKYLRNAPSVESWLESVAHNIALAEILYHPNAQKWGVFSGVHYVILGPSSNGVRGGKTILFHEGLYESNQREANFTRLISNLEGVYQQFPEARMLVDGWQNQFYTLMAGFDFLPNSPTLMNAGRELQQLSACYVLPVPDSIEGISKAVTAQSLIQKSGGGTGMSFGAIRPKGDLVKKTRGVASGAISFMQIFDKMTDVVKQGGQRRGANMGILPYWHPEIKDFISMKTAGNFMENFNISVALDDKFMKAVYMDSEYDLINPRTQEVAGKARARQMLDLIVESAWKTGDPGLVFLDKINQSNTNSTPALGQIESTNPCFAGSVRLATDKGLVTFEELYIDKTEISAATDNRAIALRETASSGNTAVKTRLETGVTMRKAVPVFKTRKNWPVFRLETEHGYEVVATEDHKFFTPNGLKELKDLKTGDAILIQSGAGVWNQDDTLPPFIPENKLKARTERGQAKLPGKWSRELGEILGWVAGDGWISEQKPKGCHVPNYTVGLMYGNEEKKLLAPKFSTLIKEWTGLEGTVVERNGTLTQYYRTALFYFLNSLGIHEKNGLCKEVPESLWKAPREAVLGFLSALFTADGTVNISAKIDYGSIRLANSSKKLLQGVQILLLNEGIVSQLYHRRSAGKKMMPDSRRNPKLYSYAAQYELVITRTNRIRFLKEIGFLTPSKQKKGEAFERTLTRGAYQESFITRVKTVTSAGHTDVYCTTEAETHSLIADGMIVTNCGEQALLPWEPCNLGSLNLSNFVTGKTAKGKFDYDSLEKAVKTSIRFLDDVIDVNNYPLQEIERMAKGNRRIGLGVMGWAECLVKLGIPYDSPKALKQAEDLMEFINDKALEASESIAKERGVFPNWRDSIYDPKSRHFRGKAQTPRNCARTTIAPTGTIAIAAGLQGSGIEPFFAISYTRFNAKALDAIKAGQEPGPTDTFREINPLFKEVAAENGYFGLGEEDLWKKIQDNHKTVRGISEIPKPVQDLFPTAHDISIESHIQTQSAFQKYTDNGVSKTINMPNSATMDDVRKAYKLSYDLGCKGITIYRDGCKAQQVLNLSAPAKSKKKKRSYESFGVSSEYFQIKTGYGPLHVHINYDEQGPYQVFTNIPPLGTEISGLTSLIGILISKYFEEGGEPMRIMKHLNSVKGDRPMGFGENRINSIAHAIAVALRSHLKKTGHLENGEENGKEKLELWEISKTLYCPKCYSSNVSYESGCSGPACHDCGYSECS